MENDIGRIAATLGILCITTLPLYSGCLRSSTIYFFELESTTVFFMDIPHAVVVPLILSIALCVSYFSAKRIKETEECIFDISQLTAVKKPASRRVSITRQFDLPGIAESEENNEESRIGRRLLSAVSEHDSVATDSSNKDLQPESEKTIPESKSEELPGKVSEVTVEPRRSFSAGEPETPSFHLEPRDASRTNTPDTDDLQEDTKRLKQAIANAVIIPRTRSTGSRLQAASASSGLAPAPPTQHSDDDSPIHSRSSSFGSRTQLVPRKMSIPGAATPGQACDIYRQLGQVDILTYVLGALDLLPKETPQQCRVKLGVVDIIAEIIATHVPIWLCVAAFYLALLEVITVKLSYYFYYHEEMMHYAAVFISFLLGVVHTYYLSWITNNILGLCSIYVVVCRVQPVSFQSGCTLLCGMAMFDLFWLYVIDLLSTAIKTSKAPLMIVLPRDNLGNKQSLSTLDVMIPGVFLNLILKYSSMYDPKLFMTNFHVLYASLVVTMGLAIYRKKITPALVLPAGLLVACSLGGATHPNDLWRFMIKH